MAGNPNPPKKYQFKKGQSGNPLGGKLHNPVLRAIKRLTAAEVAEIGALILSKNFNGLKKLVEDAKSNDASKSSALKTWIATVAMKGIAKGDAHALDVLLNRLIGRSKEVIELTGAGGGPVRSLVGSMSKAEKIAELRRLRKLRKENREE